MQKMKTLDQIDFKILNFLQEDSTMSTKEIAEKVGLSFTPTYERIKTLKSIGVIKKQVAILDAEKVGYKLIAYCNVTLKEQSNEKLYEFEQRIIKEPQVLEVVSMSGAYDYMIKVVAKSIKDYNDFMMKSIANIPNIGQYHSHIVLSVIKSETKLNLEENDN